MWSAAEPFSNSLADLYPRERHASLAMANAECESPPPSWISRYCPPRALIAPVGSSFINFINGICLFLPFSFGRGERERESIPLRHCVPLSSIGKRLPKVNRKLVTSFGVHRLCANRFRLTEFNFLCVFHVVINLGRT